MKPKLAEWWGCPPPALPHARVRGLRSLQRILSYGKSKKKLTRVKKAVGNAGYRPVADGRVQSPSPTTAATTARINLFAICSNHPNSVSVS